MILDPAELLRYQRQILLPQVGKEGQEKLKSSKVLLVGAGGLGSPAALYLAAAGVGTLGIVDGDAVDLTNLHRQVLHSSENVGVSKLESARETLYRVNPHVEVVRHETMLTSANAMEIVGGYDLVLDGTDNFPARYLVNDACVLLKKVNVYGAIFQFDGQASVFCAPGGPCYRCLYPEPPPPGTTPSCAEAGVLGVLPGLVGMIQATEAIKLLLDIGSPLVGRLLLYDSLGMSFQEIKIRRDPDCPICGEHPSIDRLIDYERFCGLTNTMKEIQPHELASRLNSPNPPLLVDVREPDEWAEGHLAGAKHIPLGELPHRVSELKNEPMVIYCRSGMRSARACEFLASSGFTQAENLAGGILSWQGTGNPVVTE